MFWPVLQARYPAVELMSIVSYPKAFGFIVPVLWNHPRQFQMAFMGKRMFFLKCESAKKLKMVVDRRFTHTHTPSPRSLEFTSCLKPGFICHIQNQTTSVLCLNVNQDNLGASLRVGQKCLREDFCVLANDNNGCCSFGHNPKKLGLNVQMWKSGKKTDG